MGEWLSLPFFIPRKEPMLKPTLYAILFVVCSVFIIEQRENLEDMSDYRKAQAAQYAAEYQQESKQKALEPQIMCLAKNIYHEARGENLEGKVAVAQVTVNRVNDPHFPKTICDVVFEPGQFTWTATKHKVADMRSWRDSYLIAWQVLNGLESNRVLADNGAVFYHAVYVNPPWHYRKITRIGKHIFYAMS